MCHCCRLAMISGCKATLPTVGLFTTVASTATPLAVLLLSVDLVAVRWSCIHVVAETVTNYGPMWTMESMALCIAFRCTVMRRPNTLLVGSHEWLMVVPAVWVVAEVVNDCPGDLRCDPGKPSDSFLN